MVVHLLYHNDKIPSKLQNMLYLSGFITFCIVYVSQPSRCMSPMNGLWLIRNKVFKISVFIIRSPHSVGLIEASRGVDDIIMLQSISKLSSLSDLG